MQTREPYEKHFKQIDQAVGLSFKANFHFALVGHLIKGYRHPTPTTVTRTIRVMTMLLAITAKPQRRDKFEVSPQNIAYLTGKTTFNNRNCFIVCFFCLALVGVSEEVRNRCHLKHAVSKVVTESGSQENFNGEQQQDKNGASTSTANSKENPKDHAHAGKDNAHANVKDNPHAPAKDANAANRRQKSWDPLDQNAVSQAARQHPQHEKQEKQQQQQQEKQEKQEKQQDKQQQEKQPEPSTSHGHQVRCCVVF